MRRHQNEILAGLAVAGLPRASSLELQPRFAGGTGRLETFAPGDLQPTEDRELAERVEQIAHDLKGPLQTLALETCLLDGKVAPGDTEVRIAVERMARNVAFLDRMVQDLVDSCSIDAGRFELRRRPTELGALISQAIDRVVATRDRPRVSLETRSRLPLVIEIDELRIERVFANLLQNALKYAPRTSRITVRIDFDGEHVRTSVIDAGPGMTVAETSRVFDKYRRGKSAVGHEGSGLGLYISKQIVEAHGGSIGATSIEGVGSQFFFELPVT